MDPLVQVLLPTYERPEFLKEALDSVFRQTYSNYRILIIDNSKSNKTEKMLSEFFPHNPKLDYHHEPNFTEGDNWHYLNQHFYDDAKYLQWLMDDDIFYPEKFEKMVAAYEQYPDIMLVTSFRHTFGDKINYTGQLVDTLGRHQGELIGKIMLLEQRNIIGEPTTALVKKSTLTHRELGWGRDEGEYVIADFPRWLDLLSRGDLIYFPEPLSKFRVHGAQSVAKFDVQITCAICWLINIRYAIRNKVFLVDRDSQREALLNWVQNALRQEQKYKAENYSSIKFSRFQKLIPHVFQAVKTDSPLDLDPIIFP